MLVQGVSRFLRDEDGSYTLWSLAWFMVYVGIGGLAVDATDVYRHQNFLQATADSAAVAGVMSLDDADEAVNYALAFAENNMERNVHGNVLIESEVELGYWDTDARAFYPNEPTKNAVYVTTRRAEANQNPLGMNMLRFLGLVGMNPWWNVNTEAVAIRFIPKCAREGFIAQQDLSWTNSNNFYNNICLHAQLGKMGSTGAVQGNTYQTGVTISRGQVDGLNFNSQEALTDDSDLGVAVDSGGVTELWPAEATRVPEYISVLKNLDEIGYTALTAQDGTHTKYKAWSFMFDSADGFSGPGTETKLPEDKVFESGTIYDLSDCGGPINLSGYTFESEVVIITSCAITAPGGADLSAGNIVIASDFVSNGNNFAINLPAQSKLGNSAYCDSKTGSGGVQFYALGNVSLAAQTDWHGVRVAAGGDVNMEAQNDVYGVSVQAGGSINFQTHGDYGLCPNVYDNGPVEWRYRIVM